MTTIYLIRHGAYENPHRMFHGRLPGFPLSQAGIKQAAHIADYLQNKPITAIYSSRLTRARQTAEIIAGKFALPVWTDERLLDIRTPLEGLPLGYLRRPKFSFYHPAYIAAGGERMEEIYNRMQNFLMQKVADHPYEHIVVVSHGDGIMTVVTKFMKKKLPDMFPYDATYVQEGQGYVLTLSPSGLVAPIVRIPAGKRI